MPHLVMVLISYINLFKPFFDNKMSVFEDMEPLNNIFTSFAVKNGLHSYST